MKTINLRFNGLHYWLILLSSCELVIDIPLPETSPRLVLRSINNISSDVVTVGLSEDRHILDNSEITYITGATVSLYNGNELIGLFSETTTPGTYQIPYHFDNEASYTIKAEKAGYETITATDTFPKANVPAKIEEIDQRQLENQGQIDFRLTFSIADPPGPNYYQVLISQYSQTIDTYYDEEFDSLYSDTIIFRNRIYFRTVEESGALFGNQSSDNYLLTDELFDGKTQNITLFFEQWATYECIPECKPQTMYIEIEVRNVSESFYKYFTTSEAQQDAEFNFLAEPVFVYNNVENGLGIVASFSAVFDSVGVIPEL